jgi:hypothetical protein
MAEFIDISDFGGVVTNVDVEDLPEHIAQNMENLRIRDGKLEKTFGAGQPANVPSFALSAVNTKLTRSYVVYNVFTFISDKLGATEHRYILVLIDSSTKQVKLFWYDPDVPAVNDHLQVEDNILYFQTASDSGYSQGDNIMVTGVKDNSNSAIASTDIYDDITTKTSNKHFINTDTATTWGGSFFATAQSSGLRDMSFGGKHGTHLNVDNDASGGISSFTDIALLALNGKVLCMYSYCSGTNIPNRIKFTIGSTSSELNTTLYNQFKGYGTFKVNAMINHSDAIWVYYSALNSGGGGQSYNAIVKYTVQSNGTIVETGFDGHDPSDSDWGDNQGQTFSSGHFYTANTGTLYLLVPGNSTSLFKVSGSTIVAQSGTPSQTSGYEWKGITSITNTVNGNKEYLIIAESSATNHKLHYIDLNNNLASWASNSYNHQLHQITKMDFGENSNKNESVIVYYERGGGEKYLQYSTHNDATVILGFADINGTIFPTTMPIINKIKHINRNPSGAKYLMVATNSSSASPPVHGALYRIDSSKTVLSATNQNPNTNKEWHPTCVDDVVTGATSGNQFFEHAKGYIVAYGVEWATSASQPRSALNRITDIGWGSGTWAGTGTVDYGWTDLHSKYNFYEISESNSSTTPTIYHQTDKNPIVPTGDTVRFIPGAIGKVSSTEAKGLWLGYINRSMFNGDYTIPANWYGYVNTLNNPFKVTLGRKYKADTNLRNGDTVKYNCTAVYDGVQESLFDKSDELILDDNDIQKHIIELEVEIANINNLNKRITGINFYRAIGNSGIYSNYQLIGHMTFVDSSNNLSSVGAIKNIQLQYSGNEVIYIKSPNTSQRDGIRTRDYSESWLGTNKYALDTDGGFDGIDNPSGDSNAKADYHDPFNEFLLYMTLGTIRPMTSSQLYVVATSNNVANSSLLSIEDENVTTASTALPSVPLTSPVDTGLDLTGSSTWATSENPKTFLVDGDATNILKVNDKIQLGTHSAVITLTAIGAYDTLNDITQIAGNADINGSASGTPDIKLREVASGEHIISLSAKEE